MSKAYNIKHISYENKDEYRFYTTPISASSGSSSDKPKYITIGEKEINESTGKERTIESIEHSKITSLKRTRQKIYDYIHANQWTNGYFLTITFNPSFIDSYNYDDCYKCIKRFIKTIRKNNPNIKYLFIPELHKSKRWHFHALITNCSNLVMTDSGKSSNGMTIYNINTRTFKYGFTEATKIQDIDKLSTYILKHITDDLIAFSKGKHRYIASDNLNTPKIQTYIVSNENMEIEKEITKNDDRIISIDEYSSPGYKITYINIRKKEQ